MFHPVFHLTPIEHQHLGECGPPAGMSIGYGYPTGNGTPREKTPATGKIMGIGGTTDGGIIHAKAIWPPSPELNPSCLIQSLLLSYRIK